MISFQHKLPQHHIAFNLDESPASQTLSPDGRWLITGSFRGGIVKIWDVQIGKLQRSWIAVPLSPYPYMNETSSEYSVPALGISPDGRTLVTGGRALRTWEFETGKLIRKFKGFGSWISYITVSESGEILLTDGTSHSKGAINLWYLQSGKKIRRVLTDSRWVISPDSKAVAGFGVNQSDELPNPVQVWDAMTGEKLRDLENNYAIRPKHFIFSPDGRLLVGAGFDGCKIWNFETGEQVRRITKFNNASFHKHLDLVYGCVFSSDGKFLLSAGSDGSIQIWSIQTGRNAGTLDAKNKINWISTSYDGRVIVGMGNDAKGNQIIDVWKILSP